MIKIKYERLWMASWMKGHPDKVENQEKYPISLGSIVLIRFVPIQFTIFRHNLEFCLISLCLKSRSIK